MKITATVSFLLVCILHVYKIVEYFNFRIGNRGSINSPLIKDNIAEASFSSDKLLCCDQGEGQENDAINNTIDGLITLLNKLTNILNLQVKDKKTKGNI